MNAQQLADFDRAIQDSMHSTAIVALIVPSVFYNGTTLDARTRLSRLATLFAKKGNPYPPGHLFPGMVTIEGVVAGLIADVKAEEFDRRRHALALFAKTCDQQQEAAVISTPVPDHAPTYSWINTSMEIPEDIRTMYGPED